MLPHTNNLGHEHDPILVLRLGKLKFNMNLILGKKGAVLTIPYVIFILDSFAVELVGSDIGEIIIIDQFKAT